MKILCLLFSLFVLLVSAAPCCADDCGQSQETVAQDGQPGDSHPEHGESKTCSPFLTCGSCAGFIKPLSTPVLQVDLVGFGADFVDTYHFSSYPVVPSSFWQPPKTG